MKRLLLILIMIAACTKIQDINNFDDCVAAGNPVMESYPRQCRAGGRTFGEELSKEENLQLKCGNQGGKWIPEVNECEDVSEADCLNMGGSFNECASACRNDPDAEICTMQCVLVCSFPHTCTKEEKAAGRCTLMYAPVCGDNGKTYGNGCSACSSGEIDEYTMGECKIIGGERDEHGCLGPAGYTWNEEVGACIREWELDEEQRKAAKMVVVLQSFYPITVVEVKEAACEGCYDVTIQRGDTDEYVTVNLKDWKIANPCTLEPDPGLCKAYMPRYYYDGSCKEFIWGGCYGVVPFETMEACENQCT